MEDCKKCGAPTEDGQPLCETCAKKEAEQVTQTEMPASEQPRKKPTSEKKRRLRNQILMGLVLVAAAAAVCAVVYMTQGRPQVKQDTAVDSAISEPADSVLAGTDSTEQPEADPAQTAVEFPSFTKDPSEVTDADKFAVVATCAGEELTNQMLAYYYWYAYNTYASYLSYYGVIDMTQPLDQQACYFNESMSWQEYFIANGVAAFTQFTLLSKQAAAEGFRMPDEAQEVLDTLEQTLQTAADDGGFASIEAYLQEYYGSFADYESYRAFMTTYYTALNYDDFIYNDVSFTDEQVSAYYDENADTIGVAKDDSLMIDVRHILITPAAVEDVLDADGNVDETATAAAAAAAKEAAREEAEALYADWQAGEATEESFGDLAYYNSDDPGSYGSGGLYEDVYPGEMVAAFNDWCFDPARQPGDTGIVETDYGYHIMYFVEYGETSYWRAQAISLMTEEAYAASFEELMTGDDTVSDLTLAVLLDPPAMSVDAETTVE